MLTSREICIYLQPDAEPSGYEEDGEEVERGNAAAADGMEPAETESREDEP